VSWRIGNVTVTRVVEIEGPTTATWVLPDAVPEELARIPWLAPRFVRPDGKLLMSVQALVIASQGRRILVDTCVGNDKRRAVSAWNQRAGPFLDELAAAGFRRGSIDRVVCTHLHVDHVGWNTMLRGGAWVPTFPNARYLIGRAEWEHWAGEPEDPEQPVMSDSVRPIVDAGLVDLVTPDAQLTDEVWLEPTPGHTPGHVSVRIASAGANAVITGDVMHHPCQIARPEWASRFDWDVELARQTRRRVLARWAEEGWLVIGTHFPAPTAGTIVKDGAGLGFAHA
jgi:glyoxylase-like metal-dependent hydrolase (beta-lactamase superfamily II)